MTKGSTRPTNPEVALPVADGGRGKTRSSYSEQHSEPHGNPLDHLGDSELEYSNSGSAAATDIGHPALRKAAFGQSRVGVNTGGPGR